MKKQDHQIVYRLRQKDKCVVADLYDRYAPVLFGVIVSIVRSEAIAEDVLQDTFIKVWKNSHTYDSSKGTLFTWLLNIARNTAIDHTRSKSFRFNGQFQSIDPERHDACDHSTQRHMDKVGVRKIVNALEEKYRVIIDLIYFQGFTQQEVQEYLGIPLGTVKSRTRIALRELRCLFDEQQITLILIMMCLGI